MPRKSRSTQPQSLAWRPTSYWDLADPVSAILVNVKGTVRRRALRNALQGSTPDAPVDELMRDELPDDERKAWGRIHPSCMGGEYLPGYLPGEVEIARIQLKSMLSDVISIRARRAGRIHYRVVDEYPEDHKMTLSPQTSARPLTLGAMVRLLWSVRESEGQGPGFIACSIDSNIEAGDDRETVAEFMTVESEIYPELGGLIAQGIERYLNVKYPVEPEEADE